MPDFIKHVHVSWDGFLMTLGILVALLFARRLLPKDRRRRGRIALVLLALSLVMRLGAGGLIEVEWKGAASVVGFLAILLEAFGITGVVALLVFDIGLARVQIDVPSLVRDILVGVVLAATTIGVLQSEGVNLVSLITTSAVLTAVIGLALQSTISNLFAGLSLQVDRTIGVGDWVHVGTRIGRISEIKWRSTLIVTRDGDNVIVPNASLLSNEVLNFSKPTREHRLSLRLGVHYRHPPNEVQRVLLGALHGVEGVLEQPAPHCYPSEFGDSALVYVVRYWINEIQRESAIDGEIKTRVWYACERAGIEIPFPIRNVYTHQVTDEQRDREREGQHAERMRAVAENDLFRVLDDADRELLARSVRTERFAGGERIIRQGAPGDSLYVVRDGAVIVRLAVDGAEREVATLGPGKFFGEMSLMTGEPRTASCVAKGDTTCHVVGSKALRAVLAAKPQIAEQLSRALGERQSALEGEREHLSAEAQARRAAENSSRLLLRIRDFFNLG